MTVRMIEMIITVSPCLVFAKFVCIFAQVLLSLIVMIK